jgi:hypothetical protein
MMSFRWCHVPFLWSGKAALQELAFPICGIGDHHMSEEGDTVLRWHGFDVDSLGPLAESSGVASLAFFPSSDDFFLLSMFFPQKHHHAVHAILTFRIKSIKHYLTLGSLVL